MGKHVTFRSPHARKYTPELFDHICYHISTGMRITKACAIPLKVRGSDVLQQVNQNTFHDWVRKDINGCSEVYRNALAIKSDVIFDELIDIIDDAEEDSGAIAKAKERISIRKWCLSKVDPTRYGDRIITEHKGNIAINNMSDDELQLQINKLLNVTVVETIEDVNTKSLETSTQLIEHLHSNED